MKRPDDYDNLYQWFAHFRMSKALPTSATLEKEMERAPDADAAKVVLTAYAATVIDISFFWHRHDQLIDSMTTAFGITPGHLMGLSIRDIAYCLDMDGTELEMDLREVGFSVEDKIISDFKGPAAQPATKRRPPKPSP